MSIVQPLTGVVTMWRRSLPREKLEPAPEGLDLENISTRYLTKKSTEVFCAS